jgi:hypothetical protein
MQEVKEGLKLDNLRTDHVMIRSELKYLIGAKIVDLQCRGFGGKSAPFPTVRVFRVVRPVATVRFRVEPNPEPTREFGPVANTTRTCQPASFAGFGYTRRFQSPVLPFRFFYLWSQSDILLLCAKY